MKTDIEQLREKVADQWALTTLAVMLTGFFLVAQFFFLQAAASTEWNAVQTALTIFETFLVLALATGFWMIRKEARERAEEVAQEEARKCVQAIASEIIERDSQSIILRTAMRVITEHLYETYLNDSDIERMMDALEDGKDD